MAADNISRIVERIFGSGINSDTDQANAVGLDSQKLLDMEHNFQKSLAEAACSKDYRRAPTAQDVFAAQAAHEATIKHEAARLSRRMSMDGIGDGVNRGTLRAVGDNMILGTSGINTSAVLGQGAGADSLSSAAPRYTPMQKLLMRLNLTENDKIGLDYMVAVENTIAGNVVVFIIKNGQPIHLEDDAVMFPSDRLIGQINTLR